MFPLCLENLLLLNTDLPIKRHLATYAFHLVDIYTPNLLIDLSLSLAKYTIKC